MGLRRCAGRLASPCPLCGNEARGGNLCTGCRNSLTTPGADTVRCPRCAQLMEGAGTVSHEGVGAACYEGTDPGCREERVHAMCHDCRAAPPGFDAACVAFDYAPPGDVLVRHLKDNSRHGLAPMLGRLVVDAWHAADSRCAEHAVVVPVPASRASMRRRGFNPAGEIARAIARELNLRLRHDCLARTREGPKQSTLSRLARQAATAGLFRADACCDGLEILLVDDVMTTGSTLDSAARALRAAGASRVTALAVARTP
jgi:ComF family protein